MLPPGDMACLPEATLHHLTLSCEVGYLDGGMGHSIVRLWGVTRYRASGRVKASLYIATITMWRACELTLVQGGECHCHHGWLVVNIIFENILPYFDDVIGIANCFKQLSIQRKAHVGPWLATFY